MRRWSRRTLEKASERVVDVHGDDPNDDDEEQEEAPGPQPDSNTQTEGVSASDQNAESRKTQ